MSVVLVLGMNVDTVSVVRQLATDNKTRAALVDKGLKAAEDALAKAADAAERERLRAALGAQRIGVANAETALDRERANVVKRTGEMAQGLINAGLRIGWAPGEAKALVENTTGLLDAARAVLIKLVGLLISAAAISLGAPFWFNTLKTLASIRSVGPSTDEAAAKRAKESAKPTEGAKK
jgi:hypothetical protein